MIRALLFDLDGTLVDSIGIIVDTVSQSLKKFGYTPDPHFIRRQLGVPIEETLKSMMSPEEAMKVSQDYYANFDSMAVKQIKLFPGVKESLEKLSKEYLLGIITGKAEKGALIALREVGIIDLFQVIVGGDTTPRGKPYPEPVIYAIDALGVTPSEAVMIGDSIHDLNAAHNAGVKSIGVLTGSFDEKELRATGCDSVYPCVTDFFAEPFLLKS